jgi:O-acetyl-ADP-ribose deacetylase (regulator of RNase III)
VMVMAFAGWAGATARNPVNRDAGRKACAVYRSRFGIETSYRQKNQARAFTTSRRAAYRLLLEGLAHLIRQVWVLLTEQLAVPDGSAGVAQLPLATLLDWLDAALRQGLDEAREIPLTQTS